MRFSCLKVTLAMLVTLPLASPPARPSPSHPPWIESLSEAFQEAKKRKQWIIADLYTDWCVWCTVMDRNTFGNPSVLEQLGNRYVWLRLNTETQADGREAQKRFGIHSYPTTLLIEPEEQLFENAQGYLGPEQFLETIQSLDEKLRTVVDLREKVNHHPEDSQLRFRLAREYIKRFRFKTAAKHYEILVKEGSVAQLDECYFYLALCLASQEKERQALERLGELKERFSGSGFVADALVLQGKIHFNLDEKKKASQFWQEYLQRFPGHPLAPDVPGPAELHQIKWLPPDPELAKFPLIKVHCCGSWYPFVAYRRWKGNRAAQLESVSLRCAEKRTKLRTNRAKQKLKEGQVATCITGSAVNSDLIESLGQFGFDAAWIECEHGPVTWDQIGDLSRTCDLCDMTALVRVPSNEPWIITRTLDRGASGIVVPHVNTKEEAESVVRSAKFAPQGQRGMYGGRRSLGEDNYYQTANDQVLVVVLIEEVKALKNLTEILTVDEIDVFFLASNDLAQTMGLIGERNHPRVSAAVDEAIQQISQAGRGAGTMADEQTVEHFIDLGARFFLTNWNPWIAAGAKSFLARTGQARAASLGQK